MNRPPRGVYPAPNAADRASCSPTGLELSPPTVWGAFFAPKYLYFPMACGLAAVPLQTPSKLAILHETLDRGAAAADLDHPPRETLFPPLAYFAQYYCWKS